MATLFVPPITTEDPSTASWEFYIRHLNRDGTVKHGILNPRFLSYTKSKYGGAADFGFSFSSDGRRIYDLLAAGSDLPVIYQDHSERATIEAILDFEDYDIIEVWIRCLRLGIQDTTAVSGRGFIKDTEYIFREPEFSTDDDLVTTWTAHCVSPWNILDWRKVLWPSSVNNRSEFSSIEAETVGKTLLQYNSTTSATTGNGRYRAGDLASGMGFTISIATDQGRGNQVELTTNGGSLLGIIVRLAAASGGDFTLTRTDDTTWEFDFNDTQQGSDKYDSVIFSVARKNMVRPHLRRRAEGAATTAIAAGQGMDDARLIGSADGDDYAANNDIELFVDARDLKTVAGLEARAAERLYAQRAQYELDFQVAQTADTFYSPVAVTNRNTYDVGDVCQAQYFGTYRRQITAVTVEFRDEEPIISIDTENILP